jgi:hypothetical protein
MNLARKIAFAVLSIIVLACTEEDESPAKVDLLKNPVTLKYQELIYDSTHKFGLKFTSVKKESRCPIDAICVTAGEVIVSLEVYQNQNVIETIDLSLPGEPKTVSLEDKKIEIKLIDALPYPVSTAAQPEPEKYSVTLEVREVK